MTGLPSSYNECSLLLPGCVFSFFQGTLFSLCTSFYFCPKINSNLLYLPTVQPNSLIRTNSLENIAAGPYLADNSPDSSCTYSRLPFLSSFSFFFSPSFALFSFSSIHMGLVPFK